SLTQNFAWQVIPFIPNRGAPESVYLVLIALILRHGLRRRSLIPEDSEVIADLHALVGSEVYVHRAHFTEDLAVVFPSHHHGHRLSAYGRKVIERGRLLERRHRTVFVWNEDIPALHVIAREYHLSDGDLGQHVDHSQLSRVEVELAHGSHELRLPLEPRHVRGILVRPHHREPVAHANTLILPTVDVHVVAARKGDLIV